MDVQLPRRSERLKRKRDQQMVTEVKQKKCEIKKQRLEEPKQLQDMKLKKQIPPVYNRYNIQEERKTCLRVRLNNKLYKIDNIQLFRKRLQDIYAEGISQETCVYKKYFKF